ncbi:hypothetical protein TIFTF001_008985 [Ficus carica]|uniref:Uncharacterized protein n=1 Tax=Ficus carica TaxID=3494 RepID=A0AA88D0Z8_FICCA|nr:hypothetical protein TIFTF001_008985 [Ficus carica]
MWPPWFSACREILDLGGDRHCGSADSGPVGDRSLSHRSYSRDLIGARSSLSSNHSLVTARSLLVDAVICSDHKVLFPIVTRLRGGRSIHPSGPNASNVTPTDQKTPTGQRPLLGDVSMPGRGPPGPHSTYYLTSDTSPVTVPINNRHHPPTAAPRLIATCSDRGYSRWHWRHTTLVSPVLSQGHVASVHWTNNTCSLRLTHPPGALSSRPGWVARAPRPARCTYK